MKTLVMTRLELADFDVYVDGYVHYHIDKHYGEDADGNRGSIKTFVDDVTDITACKDNGTEVKLTDQEIKLAEHKLVVKFLEG